MSPALTARSLLAAGLLSVVVGTRAAAAPATGPDSQVVAFVNVHVIPMDREGVLERQTVVMRDGRIVALGPANQVRVPAGAVRIDGRGKYLMQRVADAEDLGRLFRAAEGGAPITVWFERGRGIGRTTFYVR